MAVRDSRTVRVSNEFIALLDSMVDVFKKSHNIYLSYHDISKAIANKLKNINFNIIDNIATGKQDNDININFIEENIDVVKNIDAEHYATGYFKNLGYKVYFSKKIFSDERKIRKNNVCNSHNEKLTEIVFLYDDHPALKKCIHDSLGIPDLVIFKDNNFEFIEVKTNQDGLSGDQMRWMKNHKETKTSIFYLNQTIIKNEEGNKSN